MRKAPTLRAHPDVIDFEEQRRARQQPVRLMMPGFVTADMLTPSEIEALRRRAKENAGFYRKAFAHLKPIPEARKVETAGEEPAEEDNGAGWRNW